MILDEPTAALTLSETKKLFQLLHNLKKSEDWNYLYFTSIGRNIRSSR